MRASERESDRPRLRPRPRPTDRSTDRPLLETLLEMSTRARSSIIILGIQTHLSSLSDVPTAFPYHFFSQCSRCLFHFSSDLLNVLWLHKFIINFAQLLDNFLTMSPEPGECSTVPLWISLQCSKLVRSTEIQRKEGIRFCSVA